MIEFLWVEFCCHAAGGGDCRFALVPLQTGEVHVPGWSRHHWTFDRQLHCTVRIESVRRGHSIQLADIDYHSRPRSTQATFSVIGLLGRKIGNETVPKTIANGTINSFNCNQYMVIPDHNSFRVLFDRVASAYFIWKIYLFLALIRPSQGTSTVPIVSAHSRSLLAKTGKGCCLLYTSPSPRD